MAVHFEFEGQHYELPDGTAPDVAKQKILTHLGRIPKEENTSFMGDVGRSIVGGTAAAADFIAPVNLAASGLIEGSRALFPESMGGQSFEQAAQNINTGSIPGTNIPYSELVPSKLLENITGAGSIQNKQYEQANKPLHALTDLAVKAGDVVNEAIPGSPSPLAATLANLAVAGGALHLANKGAVKATEVVDAARSPSKLDKAKAEFEASKKNLQEGFEWNPTTGRLEKEGLHVDPTTGQIINTKSGQAYGFYDKPQNKPQAPEQAPLGLPNYAGEPLVVFRDGTTMTRAEFEQQKRITQDLEGTGTGITPSTPVMSPKDLETRSMFDAFQKKADEVTTLPPKQIEPTNGLRVKEEAPKTTQEVVPVELGDLSRYETIPGVEVVKDPIIDPVTGKRFGGRNDGGYARIDPAYLKERWEKYKQSTRDKFKDFDEFVEFVALHEREHNIIKGDSLLEEKQINNTIMDRDLTRKRKLEEEMSLPTDSEGVRPLPDFYPKSDIGSQTPAQFRASIEKLERELDSVVEKISLHEDGLIPSGTMDIAGLYKKRDYLESVTERGREVINRGVKAGISFKPKSGVGKKQGGAVNFGFSEFVADKAKKLLEKTPTFDEFVKSIGAERNDPMAKELYDKYYSKEIKQQLTPEQSAISKIPGLKEVVSPELIPLETMKERWQHESDLSTNPAVKHLRENLSSGGRMTALRTGNSFVDWNVENILTTTRQAQVKIKETQNAIKGEVNALTKGILSKFKDKGEGERTFVAAMTELLKSEGKDVSPNIPKEAQKLTTKLREALDELGLKIQEELKSQGTEGFQWRPNYLAGVFFGPYRSVVKDANGKVIGVVSGRTKNEASHAIDYLKEQMPDVQFDLVQYNAKFDGIDGTLSGRYGKASEVLELLKNQDEAAQKLQTTLSDYYSKVQENYMGYRQHFKQKKGVFGSEGSRPWDNAKNNAYDLLEAQLGVIDHGYHWLAEQKLMKDMDSILTDPNIKLPEAKEYVNLYLDHAFGRTKDYVSAFNSALDVSAQILGISPSSLKEMSAIARNFALTNTLGLSGGFIGTQFIQVPQALTIAFSKAKGEGITGNKSGSGMIATMDLSNILAGKLENVSTEGKFFFDYFKKNGVLDPHLVEHTIHRKVINTTGMNPVQKAIWGSINGMFKAAELESNALGKLTIEYPEAATRGTFAMTMAHFYRSAGYSLKEAAIKADKDTSTLFVDYSSQERAMIYQRMGELGKLASTVSTFKMNNLNQWVTFSNKQMYGTLAALALTSWFTAGLNGMPMGDEAEYLANMLKSKGMDIMTPKEYLMSEVPDYVAFGPLSSAPKLFGGPGVALHRKFAADNTIPDDLPSFIYPLLSFYTNKIEKTNEWVKSDFGKREGAVLAREIVPGNLKYLVDYLGLTDHKTGLTIDPNQINDREPAHYRRDKAAWKTGALLGVPTQSEFKAKQQKQLDKIAEQAWKTSKSSKVSKTVSAFNNGDTERFKQLFGEAVRYSPDSAQQVESYIKSQAIAKNMDVQTYLRYKLAKGATTQHGLERFKKNQAMEQNN